MGISYDVIAIEIEELWKLFGCKDKTKFKEIWKWAKVIENPVYRPDIPRRQLSSEVAVTKKELKSVLFGEMEGKENINIPAVFYLLVTYVGVRLNSASWSSMHGSTEEDVTDFMFELGFPEDFTMNGTFALPIPERVLALKADLKELLPNQCDWLYLSASFVNNEAIQEAFEIDKDHAQEYNEFKANALKEIEEEWEAKKKEGALPSDSKAEKDSKADPQEHEQQPSKKKRRVEDESATGEGSLSIVQKAVMLYPAMRKSDSLNEDTCAFWKFAGLPFRGDYHPRHHFHQQPDKHWWLGSLKGEMCGWMYTLEKLEQKREWKKAREVHIASNTLDKEVPSPIFLDVIPPELVATCVLSHLDLISLRSFGCVSKQTNQIARPLLKSWDKPLQGVYSFIYFIQ